MKSSSFFEICLGITFLLLGVAALIVAAAVWYHV